MSISNRFVTYFSNKGNALIYDRFSCSTISLPEAEYRALIDSGNLEQILTKKMEGVNIVPSPWIFKKTFYLDWIDASGWIGAIFEYIVIYLSLPIFILSLTISDVYHAISLMTFHIVPIFLAGVVISFPCGLLLHEFSHAVIAIRNGAFVPELGIGFRRNLALHAYTRIIGMKYVANDYRRAKIYFAGIGMNFFMASLIFMAWNFTDFNSTFILASGIVFSLQGIFNISIYAKSDGYSLLKILLHDCDFPEYPNFSFMKKMGKLDSLLFWLIVVNFIVSVIAPSIIIVRWLL